MAEASSIKVEDSDLIELIDEEGQISEYDIVSAPNDFNTLTINSFIDEGAIQTPGFQRNYVWDVKRASKLIESLILGLPVPQVFLYEESRNKFLIIDGQQRLLTVYFFMKERFPRKEKRGELRKIINTKGGLTEEILADDDFFVPFKLQLAKLPSGAANKFARLTYSTLGEYKNKFNLQPIRNVIVKQVAPRDDDSAVFEMFNRLNTGGVNLNTQEIRACLYHSDFFEGLFFLNERKDWREILGSADPDYRMRDIEIILRALSLRSAGDNYAGSMTSFINSFCKRAQSFSADDVAAHAAEWDWFLGVAASWDDSTFWPGGAKFSALLFEATYCAAIRLRAEGQSFEGVDSARIAEFGRSADFSKWSQEGSTKTVNVKGRLNETYEFIKGLIVESGR
ncbi:DUF262 domain-containing protein [Kitasatospora sp. RG8]|uniref:GmrSD restriction endonuclease domain-containing protein n=1 Tax=Kitasatospora sp. RG8 TaxID=2820815 RepID=UPI001ADF684D|nr:DUF262 domain-containing protein [Kitasatospora sp. RG8]MBP0453476.1 DUF262 domain-containing protein [Kitasatospora sp. RG8]